MDNEPNNKHLILNISAHPVYSYIDELNMRQLVEEPKLFPLPNSNNQILNEPNNTKTKSKFIWLANKLLNHPYYVIGLCCLFVIGMFLYCNYCRK